MTKPRDLTNPEWQQSVTDDAIADSIRRGRGAMPAFPLPESTIGNLVQLIRLLGGHARTSPPAAPAETSVSVSAPAVSAVKP
jgi:mono/diheme cytochrome c family protein